MLPPLIHREGKNDDKPSKQRGVTIALVAVSMVVIIGMAALPSTWACSTRPRLTLSALRMQRL
jgi:hypothetical protein